MLTWLSDGRRLLALAIIFAALAGAWMFRYERVGQMIHQNRFTGAICSILDECWFESWSSASTRTPAPAPTQAPAPAVDGWEDVPPAQDVPPSIAPRRDKL